MAAIWELPLTTVGDIRLSEAAFGQWIKTARNDISPKVIVRG